MTDLLCCYFTKRLDYLNLDQYMDIVGVWVELGFILITLDIDQYLDVTDFVGLRSDVWISYL